MFSLIALRVGTTYLIQQPGRLLHFATFQNLVAPIIICSRRFLPSYFGTKPCPHKSLRRIVLRYSVASLTCDFSWPAWPIHDQTEESQLLEVLRSGEWWYGEKVRQFEREFAAFQGAAYGVTCTNGTTAIEMGLRALGVVPGDEVIVPPYTFIATATAVVTVGAIPVFADIDPETLCLDPDDVGTKDFPAHAGHHSGPCRRTHR